LQLDHNIIQKLSNFQPSEFGRKKKTRLYRIKNSKVLENLGRNNQNIDVNINTNSKKDALKEIIISKGLN